MTRATGAAKREAGHAGGPKLRAVSPEPPVRITTPEGSAATIEEGRLTVRDGDGALLFEYDPEGKRAVVHVPTGDLAIAADRGKVELRGAEGVVLRSDVGAVDVEAPVLRAGVGLVDVDVDDEATFTARALRTTVDRLRQRVELVEVTAGRIVERARESYRDVQDLAQTRAGRIRFVADKTFHVLGTRTLLKARKDLKLKGDKIHLG